MVAKHKAVICRAVSAEVLIKEKINLTQLRRKQAIKRVLTEMITFLIQQVCITIVFNRD